MKKSVFLFIFICIALTGASYAYPKQEVSTKKTQKTKTVKPTFAFIFDDGLTSDVNVFNKFNEYGFKCGFAIITGKLEKSRIAEYLEYQKQGFEILSHSVTHPFFQGVKSVTPETAEAEFKKSRDTLTAWGFTIKGFVTPMSQMDDQYVPFLDRYYQYAYTVYYGAPKNLPAAYHTAVDNPHKLKRLSLENTAPEADTLMMAEIDACIAKKGILYFYAHKYPDKLTELRLTAILTKLKPLANDDAIDVLTPYTATRKYFLLSN